MFAERNAGAAAFQIVLFKGGGGGGMRLRHDQLLAPVVGAIRVLVFTAFV